MAGAADVSCSRLLVRLRGLSIYFHACFMTPAGAGTGLNPHHKTGNESSMHAYKETLHAGYLPPVVELTGCWEPAYPAAPELKGQHQMALLKIVNAWLGVG